MLSRDGLDCVDGLCSTGYLNIGVVGYGAPVRVSPSNRASGLQTSYHLHISIAKRIPRRRTLCMTLIDSVSARSVATTGSDHATTMDLKCEQQI